MKGFVHVLEIDGIDFLVDCGMLYKPASIVAERGYQRAEIYLSDPVSIRHPGRFSDKDLNQIVDLVEANQEDLLDAFYGIRDDAKRGRLRERHDVRY